LLEPTRPGKLVDPTGARDGPVPRHRGVRRGRRGYRPRDHTARSGGHAGRVQGGPPAL